MKLIYNLFDSSGFKSSRDGRIEYPQIDVKRNMFCDALTTKVQGKLCNKDNLNFFYCRS